MSVDEYLAVRNRFAPWHTLRYKISLEWINPYIQAGSRILDMGGQSPFSDVLKEFSVAEVLTDAVPDLRYQFPFPDEYVGLVLCMEILEHLGDRGDSRVDIFTGSGIKNALAEAHRVLQSDGCLFLTTPNVCCYNSIWRIFEGEHPFSHQPHFRELCVEDVREYLEQADFEVEKLEVLDVWEGHKIPEDIALKIDEASAALGCVAARGDCIFAMGRKV